MSKKKVDKQDEIEYNTEEEFAWNATAYLPVYNAERKKMDIWNIRVLTDTAEMLVEIEEMNYCEMYRAVHDIKIRIDQDMVKKAKGKK